MSTTSLTINSSQLPKTLQVESVTSALIDKVNDSQAVKDLSKGIKVSAEALKEIQSLFDEVESQRRRLFTLLDDSTYDTLSLLTQSANLSCISNLIFSEVHKPS